MSDARWTDITADFAGATRHFNLAAELFDAGGFDRPGLEGYRAEMAFMHAMQAGHTSFENGLVRLLELLGEEKPTGERWRADLIRRVASPLASRPAVLAPDLARAADHMRRFRNVAVRAYDNFEPDEAVRAVDAARLLASRMNDALVVFRTILDP